MTDIAELNISDRIYRVLVREKINTAEELCALSEAEILRFEGLGRLGFDALVSALVRTGYAGPRMYRHGKTIKPKVRVSMVGRVVA